MISRARLASVVAFLYLAAGYTGAFSVSGSMDRCSIPRCFALTVSNVHAARVEVFCVKNGNQQDQSNRANVSVGRRRRLRADQTTGV